MRKQYEVVSDGRDKKWLNTPSGGVGARKDYEAAIQNLGLKNTLRIMSYWMAV